MSDVEKALFLSMLITYSTRRVWSQSELSHRHF